MRQLVTVQDRTDGFAISSRICVTRRGEDEGRWSVSVATINQENGEELHQMKNHDDSVVGRAVCQWEYFRLATAAASFMDRIVDPLRIRAAVEWL